MTATQLKSMYQNNGGGHFFDRKTMSFFGDTIKNFGVISHNEGWLLYRKNQVKHGLKGGFIFSKNGEYIGVSK